MCSFLRVGCERSLEESPDDRPYLRSDTVTITGSYTTLLDSTGYGPIKTLAVRINESTRAQLDIIAQLNDRTVTDEIRMALEAWIEKTKADPATLQRAEAIREEIEREAATKREAIAAIFNEAKPTTRSQSTAKR